MKLIIFLFLNKQVFRPLTLDDGFRATKLQRERQSKKC